MSGPAITSAHKALRLHRRPGLWVVLANASVLLSFALGYAGLLVRTPGQHLTVGILLGVEFVAIAVGGVVYLRRLRHRRPFPSLQEGETLRALLDATEDAVYLTDPDGVIRVANEATCQRLGVPSDDIVGHNLASLIPQETREQALKVRHKIFRTGEPVFFETERDGAWYDNSVHAITAPDGRVTAFAVWSRDITLRKATEARIRRLNRLLRTVSEVNQLIVRERDRDRVLNEVCRILVEQGEFRMVWVGFADETSGRVIPAASAGIEQKYLSSVTFRFDDTPLGQGPTGTAIRENRVVLINDWDKDERVTPWREAARSRGYRSAAAYPLSVGGKVIGALTVYLGDAGAFDEEIAGLLAELAGDLGFALEALALTAEHMTALVALRESEERYRSLVDEAPVGMYRTTPSGAIVAANPALLRMLGYASFEELAARDLSQVGYEPTYPREEFKRRMEREGEIRGFESGWIARDGRTVLVRENAQAIRGNDGSVAYYEGTVEDITNLKRGEEERLKLGAAIEQAAEMIVITDIEGRIEYVNPAFERLTGYLREEAIGQKPSILKSGRQDAAFYGRLWRTITGGRTWRGHFVNRRKDGSLFEEDATISPIKNAAGTIVSFVAAKRDVTQEMTLEDQLEQAQKMDAIGSLAGGVAHDFNNILQALLSQAQLLGIHANDPERVKTLGLELGQQISHGASLTRQLLLFSRRETAKPEILDLNDSVRNAMVMLRRLVRANIAVEMQLAPKALLVKADRGQMEQVLVNLTVNASDAMPDGGTLILRTGEFPGERVWLSVEDSGTGIPEAIRKRIFEPFFTTKGVAKGTGLGLAVVHGIVTRNGGRIEVESVEGQGTVFRVILLAAGAGELPAAEGISQRATELPAGHGERILVVEDEDAAREALRDIVQSLGYEVIAVASGEEAGTLPEEEPFDVLLTDLMLPGISGPQLAAGLQDRWPPLKVILMSGYTEDEAVRRGVGEGNVRFLQKPFGVAALATEIQDALASTS
jgi:PAS domain S-box-containing protein